MPKDIDPAKRKKQVVMIAVLAFGLIAAILTQPRPTSTHDDAVKSSTATAEIASISSVSLKPAPSESNTDLDRFHLRELSRIDWDQIRMMRLFRPRPMEAALAASPQTEDEPMRVEAIYGTINSNEPTSDLRSTRPGWQGDSGDQSQMRRSALIGRAIVRPGEALPDGRTVLSVTAEGVAVTP
jgi:hypothetical protein